MTAITPELASTTGLTQATLEKIVTVLADEPHITQALLYGSRARGTARTGSDIDLALEGDALTLADKARIELALDDLLLPWKIDLCLLASVDDANLLANIRHDEQLLYQKKTA